MASSEVSPLKEKNHPTAVGRSGQLFIVCAPSGAGKTTLCKAVRRHFADLAYSVSYTTRTPRDDEVDGGDYHFITLDEFEKGIAGNRWAEWAKVHGNYYGSSARWIGRTLNNGRNILMDIDVQGARQILKRFPQAVAIFIMPPSMEELEKRLRARGTDSRDAIALRLANAREEIAQKGICRHVVVNDNLEEAAQLLIAIIEKYIDDR